MTLGVRQGGGGRRREGSKVRVEIKPYWVILKLLIHLLVGVWGRRLVVMWLCRERRR